MNEENFKMRNPNEIISTGFTQPGKLTKSEQVQAGVPLGTIISSMLNYDDFITSESINKDRSGVSVNANISEWAPCDGRDISGSALAGYLGKHGNPQTTPDLRGKFLRGLNQMHREGEPMAFDLLREGNPEDEYRLWRQGTFQKDSFASHTHGYPGRFLEADNGDGFAGLGFESNSKHDFDHTVYVNYNGGSETRPRNISVYFYIKIN